MHDKRGLPQEWSATHSQPQTIRRQEEHPERLHMGISARTASQEAYLAYSSREHVHASQERLRQSVEDPRLLQGRRNLRAPSESRADFADYTTSRANPRFQNHESSLGQAHRTHPHTMNASPWAGVSPASFSMPFAEHAIPDGAQDGYGSAQYYSLHPDEETVRGDHGRLAQTRGSRVHGSDIPRTLASQNGRDDSAMYQHGQPYLGNPESTLREQISRQQKCQLIETEPHGKDGSQLAVKRNLLHEKSAPRLKSTDHVRGAPEIADLGIEQELRGAHVQATHYQS